MGSHRVLGAQPRLARQKIQRANIPAGARQTGNSLTRGFSMEMWTDDQMRSIHKMLNPRSI
ncbi:MAG TPA: hypothetical protein VNM70_02300, partial [Burkholderiales bacterium]|nr:hypothetical protein [Burkholderiales bacterium]